jgi:K+-transporting ATPase ATPase C chain
MFTNLINQIKTAIFLLFFLTFLTGFIYPLLITGIAQLFFPWRANGSLLQQQNKIRGSYFIGQSFHDPNYFWSRPSATGSFPYDAAHSSGSNLGPANPLLISAVAGRAAYLRRMDPDNQKLIPVDLVTASGSGLDPEISPLAAFYQVHRIAKARGLSEDQLNKLIEEHISPRAFWVLGEPRVNVVILNMALDNKDRLLGRTP